MAKGTIKTSLGPIWTEDQAGTGDMRVWWPYASRAGELAVGVLEQRAKWHPKSKGWYVPAKLRDEVRAELEKL